MFSAKAPGLMFGPWRCGAQFDQISQIGLKPALISLYRKKYSITTCAVVVVRLPRPVEGNGVTQIF